MRRTRSIRLALLAVAAAVGTGTGFAQALPSAQTVLKGMIDAMGGTAFSDVKDIEVRGRFFSFRRNEIAASDTYVDYIKFPDMERTEFGREKQKTIQINKGLEGWTIEPPKGKGNPEVQEQSSAQTEDFLKNFQTSFDYVTRFVVSAPKTSLLYSGSEVVDFRRADVLEVRDSQKNLMRIFIDRETRLPKKVQIRRASDAVVHDEHFANWHQFQGVMTPLMVVRYRDGVKTMEIRAETVKYNSGLPDSLFAPPPTSSK